MGKYLSDRKIPSSEMLRRVPLVRTNVIRVTKIGELGTLVVTSNRRKLRRYSVAYSIVYACSVRRLLVTANVVLDH
jgi:hypothetical protein